MGAKLTEAEEVLFRQIHPNFIQDGEPSSDRFRPSAKDENKLSLDRSSIVSAADAHAAYVATGLQSAAVYGLNVGEFGAEAINCEEDPIPAAATNAENKAHALADYSPHAESKQKLIGKRLKKKAIARGRLHPPAEGEENAA